MSTFSYQTPVQFWWKWILYKLTLVSQSGWPLPRVPLNQGGPPCSSPAWPRMAMGSDRFWLLELRVSHTFPYNLRSICSVHGCPARRAARVADPDGSPRSCSTFREGGLEGPREWNPNRPVSETAADRELIRESFEKQPVRTVAETCERTLSTQRNGTGIGDAVRNHVVVPAVVFAQSEPDRTTVEVHQNVAPFTAATIRPSLSFKLPSKRFSTVFQPLTPKS